MIPGEPATQHSSFSDVQKSILQEKFSVNAYPTPSDYEHIAKEIGDELDRVKVME